MKWIIIMLMTIVVMNTASAGFFATTDGGGSESNAGFFAIVRGWFTPQACIENWQASISSCTINDTRVVVYEDANSCGTYVNLPASNGTVHDYCNYCNYNLVVGDLSACAAPKANETKNVSVFDSNWETCCQVTGLDSDCYTDDTTTFNRTYFETRTCEEALQVDTLAISVLLVGFMFFLIYVASQLRSKDDYGNLVPINAMAKMILFALAGITGFFAIQTAYGISIAASLSNAIESNLATLYQLAIWLGIIFLFILLFGIAINIAMHYSRKINEHFKNRRYKRNRR